MLLQDAYKEYLQDINDISRNKLYSILYTIIYSNFNRKHKLLRLHRYNDVDAVNNIILRLIEYKFVDRKYESAEHFYKYFYHTMNKMLNNSFIFKYDLSPYEYNIFRNIINNQKVSFKYSATRQKHLSIYRSLTNSYSLNYSENAEALIYDNNVIDYITKIENDELERNLLSRLNIKDKQLVELFLKSNSLSSVSRDVGISKQAVQCKLIRIFNRLKRILS